LAANAGARVAGLRCVLDLRLRRTTFDGEPPTAEHPGPYCPVQFCNGSTVSVYVCRGRSQLPQSRSVRWLELRFDLDSDFSSTVLRPFDDLHYPWATALRLK